MYVCICHGVTEKQIRAAAAEGVQSVNQLTFRTGCGGTCGQCLPAAGQLLAESAPATREADSGLFPVLAGA